MTKNNLREKMTKHIEHLTNIANSWNGEDKKFMCGGVIYYEEDALEALDKLRLLEDKQKGGDK